MAESFFQILKRERIRRKIYIDRDEARCDVFSYIEMFYNPKGRHRLCRQRFSGRVRKPVFQPATECLEKPGKFKLLLARSRVTVNIEIMSQFRPESGDFEARIANIALKDLERENKLPSGYLMALRDADSDWEFVVKLSLILEALLTRAILLEAGSSLSYESVSRESQSRRLRRAEELGVIDKTEKKMLISVSEIRNAFVHRIENLTRPLSEYFKELEQIRQNQIANSILGAGISGGHRRVNDQFGIEQFIENFRQIIMRSLFPTLIKLGYSYEDKQREKKYLDWRLDQERRLGRALPPRTECYLADRIMVLELVAAEVPIH